MTMYIEHVLLKITRCIVVRILYSIIHKHILDMLDCICKRQFHSCGKMVMLCPAIIYYILYTQKLIFTKNKLLISGLVSRILYSETIIQIFFYYKTHKTFQNMNTAVLYWKSNICFNVRPSYKIPVWHVPLILAGIKHNTDTNYLNTP